MGIFGKAVEALSDAALRREADRAEAVRAELAKREQARAEVEDREEAERLERERSAKRDTLRALAASTAAEIAKATAELDAAVRGLAAHERRDGLLARHGGLICELRALGEDVPEPVYPGLSEEALKTAERVWTDLGISLGVAVVARPLLSFKYPGARRARTENNMTNIANHPRIYRATPAQRAVMSGGSTLGNAMSPDLAALDTARAAGHPTRGDAPAVPPATAGTLPGSSLTLEALANAADSAARAKAAGVSIPTRAELAASEAPAPAGCPACRATRHGG